MQNYFKNKVRKIGHKTKKIQFSKIEKISISFQTIFSSLILNAIILNSRKRYQEDFDIKFKKVALALFKNKNLYKSILKKNSTFTENAKTEIALI
jgi:hypothetical protein